MELTAFLGLSHLGIISSAGWASLGNRTVAIDPAESTVAALQRGQLPVLESGLPELLAQTWELLTYSTDMARLADCSVVVLSRDIPTDGDNHSELQSVTELLDRAIPYLRDEVVLVVMSQIPPGFMRGLKGRLETTRPELRFTLYYWVETLIFGTAVERFLRPERLIVGCDDPDSALHPAFAKPLGRFGCPILPMSYASAELTKTAINLYLVGSVTYANTLADLCERVGADWSQIVPALRLDKRIGPSAYLQPSLGVAGGNLERDLVTLQSLAAQHGADAGFIEMLTAYNARRYSWLLSALRRYVFSKVSFPTLAVWGLTYKKNTRSTKNSPALRLISDLAPWAKLRVWDPVIEQEDVDLPVEFGADRDDVLRGADGLIIANDSDVFGEVTAGLLQELMRRAVVIDCVNILKPREAELAGTIYVAMGKQPRLPEQS